MKRMTLTLAALALTAASSGCCGWDCCNWCNPCCNPCPSPCASPCPPGAVPYGPTYTTPPGGYIAPTSMITPAVPTAYYPAPIATAAAVPLESLPTY